ncbi:hypothetical protein TSUD_263510 [Trifolium subterraneum]|uniref:Uncharacterized protein n=1 Tax=Trifolium subterraneum TaxID=3900 RepID=A0A2Z6NAE6_TRISU|nr:hypothetical protein TSUD_263510 [Trifolium subterraneum]
MIESLTNPYFLLKIVASHHRHSQIPKSIELTPESISKHSHHLHSRKPRKSHSLSSLMPPSSTSLFTVKLCSESDCEDIVGWEKLSSSHVACFRPLEKKVSSSSSPW